MTRKALIVGINDYPDCPLSGCINDAKSIEGLLKKNGDESPNFETKIFGSDSFTKVQLKREVRTLFSGDPDVALFYFSGHGYIDTALDTAYLVTPDFSSDDMGLSMRDLLNIANRSGAKNKILILDACHSGAYGSERSFGESRTCEIISGTTVLTASRSDEAAIESSGGHGIFTELLIAALEGGAADIGGNITPGGIYSYIDKSLGAWEQRPVFLANISKFVSVRNVAPKVPPEILRKIKLYFPASDTEFPLDSSYEWTNAPDVTHDVHEPYAKDENVAIFKDMQKFRSVNLVEPIGEDDMYFAAMHGRPCRLTALGRHYWGLANQERI